jgi:hypothetical protein
MSPIVTLTWDGTTQHMTAYGPRGTRYEVAGVRGLYECRAYTPEAPGGRLVATEGSAEAAMLAAQRDVEALTELIGAEAQALASSGRTSL